MNYAVNTQYGKFLPAVFEYAYSNTRIRSVSLCIRQTPRQTDQKTHPGKVEYIGGFPRDFVDQTLGIIRLDYGIVGLGSCRLGL